MTEVGAEEWNARTISAEDIIAAYERGEHPPIEVHPAAACFPLLGNKRLDELAQSIKESGLMHAIVLTSDGFLLDGRNRLRACEKAKVKPRFEIWRGVPGGEIAAVLDANETRRIMSEAQRAMAGASLGTLDRGRPKSAGMPILSQEKIAKALRVSTRAIGMATKILKEAPQVVMALVAAGKLSLSKGEAIAKCKDAQAEFKDLTEKKALSLAKKYKVRKPSERANSSADAPAADGKTAEASAPEVVRVLADLRICLSDKEQRQTATKLLSMENHADVRQHLLELLGSAGNGGGEIPKSVEL